MKEKPLIKYPPPLAIDAARGVSYLFSKLLWRIKYHQTENIPRERETGLLIVANHQTYFDPFWICAPMRRKYRFMAWNEAFDWFLIGWLIRYLGSYPVDTKKGTGTKRVWRDTLAALADGATIVVFPEAARAFADGRMFEFRPGATRLAMEAGVPILPVTVRGGNTVWPQGWKYPKLGRVEIFYHPLVEVEKPARKEEIQARVDEANARLIEIIESKLEERPEN